MIIIFVSKFILKAIYCRCHYVTMKRKKLPLLWSELRTLITHLDFSVKKWRKTIFFENLNNDWLNET